MTIFSRCCAALALGCVAFAALAQGAVAPPAPVAAVPPIFVLNSQDASISVVDPQTWTERQRIPTGKEPHHMYPTPDGKSLIIANAQGDSLTFIDPQTGAVQRTVRDILDPYHLRFSPDMQWLVIVGNRLNHVDLYRWNGKDLQLAKRIPTGKTPSHVWIDSRSSTAYVTMQESDEFVAIDLRSQTLKWRAPTGSLPADIYGAQGDKLMLIALTGGKGVEVYDVTGPAPKLLQTIATGAGAHAFRGAGDQRHVYVSNRLINSISKIDTHTLRVVATLPGPSGPDCMDLSPDGRYLYVASRWVGKLSVIDTQTKTVVRQVKVGKSPHGVWTYHHAPR